MERAKVVIRGIAAASGITINHSLFGGGSYFNKHVFPKYVSAATVSRWPTCHKARMCRTLLRILHGLIYFQERRPGNGLDKLEDSADSDMVEMLEKPWLEKLLIKALKGLHPDNPDWDGRVKIFKSVGEAHLTAYKLWRKRCSDGLNDVYSTRPWLEERLEILVMGFEAFQNHRYPKARSCLGAERRTEKRADMESIKAMLRNLQSALETAGGNDMDSLRVSNEEKRVEDFFYRYRLPFYIWDN